MIDWQILGSVIADAIGAAIAAIGFSVISNPPRRAILHTAILAAIGHSIRFVLLQYAGLDLASASFVAAFSIGILSLLAAYKLFCPATVLYIPALLPMIPGMYAYRTVFSLIKFLQNNGNENEAIHYLLEMFKNGITTASVLFSLAVGATIPIFIFYKRAFSMTRTSHRAKPKK
ncbi:MAG TPA: threonine/serine exporter family protein [Candidatus Barnesiella excrementigallinarum]|nr:threonine/serine exporter family protein [Candidatus Barnesiella excrementigallinarum]